MSVAENLELGAYLRTDHKAIADDLARVFDLFPRLKERRKQLAGLLSGGEQQMLAMGRALMARPTLMIMDEPSMGLSPIFVERVFDTVQNINSQGVTIFMVEQNANLALTIANRGYVLQTGEVVLEDTAANLLLSELVRKTYLGESIDVS
jgi:branched-chain amino acid transport system ATP-binding protein